MCLHLCSQFTDNVRKRRPDKSQNGSKLFTKVFRNVFEFSGNILIRLKSPFSIRNWCWPKPWGCSTSATSWSAQPACPRRSAATPRPVPDAGRWTRTYSTRVDLEMEVTTRIKKFSILFCPEVVFLVSFGTSSFPAKHEVYGKNIKELVPSLRQARSQLVSSLTKNTAYVNVKFYAANWVFWQS